MVVVVVRPPMMELVGYVDLEMGRKKLRGAMYTLNADFMKTVRIREQSQLMHGRILLAEGGESPTDCEEDGRTR
jgi:hypothetical protein